MPEQRTHKSIAERLDIEFNRRGGYRRFRRWALVLALAAPLVWLTGAAAAGWNSIYWSQPVSTAHQFMANDCQRCHTESFQPLLRTVTLSEGPRSVSDASCRACHAQTAGDHHPVAAPGFEHTCVTCHHEHRGHESLARVASAQCTNCHAHLPATDTPPLVAAEVTSLEQHPEFAVLAPAERSSQRFSKGVPGQKASAIVANDSGSNTWHDAAHIKFNHAKHLVPEGVLMPWQAEQGAPSAKAVHKVLACADCHEPEGDGHYMKPIAYERHCATCHILSFSEKLVPGGPLPHAAPLLVQSTLRERLLAYAKTHTADTDKKTSEPPRLPNKPAPEPTQTEAPWAWVEQELATRGGEVFRTVANGCAHCHAVQQADVTGEIGLVPRWTITPTAIPNRWLPYARFRHDKHETVACTSCHAAAQSKLTSDILLPSLKVCQQCHASDQTFGASHARADCVECHDYHHSLPTPGRPLEELLNR